MDVEETKTLLVFGLMTFLHLTTAASIAIPTTPKQKSMHCSRQCNIPKEPKFHFARNSVYEFGYKAEMATFFLSAPAAGARVVVTATANVYVITLCDFVLNFRDVVIMQSGPTVRGSMQQSDKSHDFRVELERTPLRFSFQDGRIPDLCPTEEETTWTLNIKRGFLSALQNSMKNLSSEEDLEETDIHGHCSTSYKVLASRARYSTVIKTRNISSCSRSYAVTADFSASMNDFKPKSASPLSITHECRQTIDSLGHLHRVVCSERRHFRLLQAADEHGGAVSTTFQEIRFLHHSARSLPQHPFTKRLSLQFEPVERDFLDKKIAMEKIKQILQRFCQHFLNGFQPETPRDFWELVTLMRQLDVPTLKTIYESASVISLCPHLTNVKKTVQDALAMTGSEASVRLMSKLLTAGDVHGLQARVWLSSLGLLPAVTENMLAEVKALLEAGPLTVETLLPMSSMVRTYCRTREDCGDHPSVSRIMLALKRFVGITCDVEKMTMEKIVRGLRAIGNTGQAAHVQDVLDNCVRRKYFPEVRIAALQAFCYMPCSVDRTRAEGIFHDLNEDWEVRIASYLVIMQCPTTRRLSAVRDTTTEDKNEQVRSFVKSHVVNLLKKARSQGQEPPAYLGDEDFSSWEKEDQKFLTSKNIYASFFSDHHNLGIHVDADVLWPSSSSLPFSFLTSGSSNTSLPWLARSSSVKVAVDAFGRKWNLMEAGFRGEGLEPLLETFISSYFPEARSSLKRSFKANAASGSLYVRFLDRDVAFLQAEGLALADQAPTNFGLNWMSAFSALSGEGDHTFTQNFVLTDILIVTPTSSGLTLTLGFNSSASVELRLSGKLDFQVQTSKLRDLHLSGNIRASGIISVAGTMAIDAMVTRAGLRMSGVARSSATLGGHMILEKGQSLRVQLDVPQDQIDIADVRSEFALIHNSVEEVFQPPAVTPSVRKTCTGAHAARITGLELCAKLQLPGSLKSLPPFAPFALSVTLHKTDTHSGYSLLARHVQTTQSIITVLEIKTPGSQVDRGIGFDLLGDMADPKDVRVHLGVSTPWKSAKVTGSVTNTPSLKSVSCRLIIDKAVTYAVTAEVKVTRTKQDVTYFPVLEVRRSGFPEWSAKGVVNAQSHWKALTADVSVQGVTQFPLILKASIINTNHEKSVRLTAFNDAGLSYTLAGGTSFTIGKDASRAEVDYFLVFTTPTTELVSLSGSGGYRMGQMLKTDLKLTVDNHKPLLFRCVMTKAERRTDLLLHNLELSLKAAPAEFVLDVTLDVKRGRMLSSRVTLVHDVPSFLPRDKITVGAKATDHSISAMKSCYVTINVDSVASPDCSFSLKFLTEHRSQQTDAEMVFKHGKEQKDPKNQITFSAKVKHDAISVTKANIGYKVLATAPGQDIEIHLKGHHIHTTRSLDSACDVTFGTGQRSRAHLTFKDRSTVLLTLTGEVRVEAPGVDVSAKTAVVQKNPKHFVHSISYKQGEERKGSVTTILRASDEESFSVSSDIQIHDWQTVKAIGDTRLDAKNFKVAGSVICGDKQYGATAISILDSNWRHKFKASLFYPGELYSLTTNGEQRQDSYHGNVKLETEGEDNVHRKLFVITGSLLANPKAQKDFRKLKLVAQTLGVRGFLTVDNEVTRIRAHGRMFRGRRKSSYSTTFEVKKPVSAGHLELLWTTLTPDRDCQRTEFEVVHTMHPTLADVLERAVEHLLSRVIERPGWLTAAGPDFAQVVSLLSELHDSNARSLNQYSDENERTDKLELNSQGQIMHAGKANILAGVSVKWIVDEPADIVVNLAHKHGASLFEQTFKLDGKSKNCTFTFTLNNQFRDTLTHSAGELDLVVRGRTTTAQWYLENTGTKIQSNFTSSWGPADKVYLQIHAHRDGDKHHDLVGDVSLQTPWQPIKDWAATLLHAHASDSFRSKSSLRRSGVEIASHRAFAVFTPSLSDANITIVTPWTSKFSAAFQSQDNSTTLACAAEVRWTPRDRISADGKLALRAWDDASAVLRLETSFPGARVIVYEMSTSKTGHGLNSFVMFKLGSGRTYGLETLLRKEPVFVRLKVQSPFESFRVLEAGVVTFGNLTEMKAKADFRVYPVIGKCDCFLEWSYDPDLFVKLRINTPLKVFPGLELVTRLNSMGPKHVSHLSLYLQPAGPYTVDTELSFDLPFLVSVEAKTAAEGFKKFSTAFKHQMNQSLMAAELEVFYPRHQTFETKGTIHWNNTVNGSAAVGTDFGIFRECYVNFWHEGSLQDFSARGKFLFPRNLTAFFTPETDQVPRERNENTTIHFTSTARVGDTDVLDADMNYTRSQEIVELVWSIHFKNSDDLDIAGIYWRHSENVTSVFLASVHYGDTILCDANITVSGRTSGVLQSTTVQSESKRSAENSSVDITLKCIHPLDSVLPTSRTSSRTTVKSQLGRDDVVFSSRLVHAVRQNVSIPGCCQDHRLRVAFGRFTRSFEIDGAWSDSMSLDRPGDAESGAAMDQRVKALHVAFFWDPHHNRSKSLTFDSLLSTGDVTTLDVAFASPAIDRELRLKQTLQTNKSSWTATTSFSYSPDPRKVVTIVTRCSRSSIPCRIPDEKDADLNNTENLPETFNHLAFFRVEHPYSNLDLGLVSCLSAKEMGYRGDLEMGYTGDLEMWYVTAQRHRKYVSTHSAVRQLGRLVEAQVRTSDMVWRLQANLSGNAHLTLLTGYHDNITQGHMMTSEIMIDMHQRKIVLQLASLLADHRGPELVLEGTYVNDSFVSAVLRHNHVTEGLLAIRLNTSAVLHTRLHWRPESLATFREFVISGLVTADVQVRRTFQQTLQAIGAEIAARHSRLATAISDDVTPWLELYPGDLDATLENFQRFLQEIFLALPENKIGFQNFGVGEASEAGAVLDERVHSSGSLLSKQGRQFVKMIRTLPVNGMHEELQHLAFSAMNIAKVSVRKGTRALLEGLAALDEHLQEISRRTETKLPEKSRDLERGTNCSDPSIYRALATSVVSNLHFAFRKIASAVGGLKLYYQAQGTWLEDNLQTAQAIGSRLNSIALTLQKILWSELAHRMRHFRCFESNRFTVWRPHVGEVQAEVCLPVSLHRLDTWPSVGDYVASMQSAVLSYYMQSNSTAERSDSKQLVERLDEDC